MNKSSSKGWPAECLEFWTQLLPVMNSKSTLFKNISPRTTNWIAASSGVPGVNFGFVVSKRDSSVRTEVYVQQDNVAKSNSIYDQLFDRKIEIESALGTDYRLLWQRLDKNQSARIAVLDTANLETRDNWNQIIDSMTNTMIELEKAFRSPIDGLNL